MKRAQFRMEDCKPCDHCAGAAGKLEGTGQGRLLHELCSQHRCCCGCVASAQWQHTHIRTVTA